MTECTSETGEHKYEVERDEFMNKTYTCVHCGEAYDD